MARSDLLVLTNENPNFYRLVGPFLANRAVHESLGGVPWDEPGKTWIIALASDGTVDGFIGLTAPGRAGASRVESLYTPPGRHSVAPRLVEAAVKEAGGRPLDATVARPKADAYLAAGFTLVREKSANFLILHRTREATP
ncbi:hypothetical protein ACWDRR_22635 [Kitasatospora sp. NPDC003701]